MEIRRPTVEDAVAISVLIRSFDRDVSVNPDGSAIEQYVASTSAEAEARYIASARYIYLAAFDASRLVGVVALPDRTHLFHLFVERDSQRHGLGRALWRAALSAVDPEREIEAFTVNSTESALPVYERF